jgi:hypothetical protein
MPNECHSNIKIVGPKEIINEIYKSHFFFSYFFPQPNQPTTDWYMKNWGVHQEACNVKIDKNNDESLFISCTTAWTVPINFLKNLVNKYPELYIFIEYSVEYSDCGIFILYYHENQLVTRQFNWFDPINNNYIKGVNIEK